MDFQENQEFYNNIINLISEEYTEHDKSFTDILSLNPVECNNYYVFEKRFRSYNDDYKIIKWSVRKYFENIMQSYEYFPDTYIRINSVNLGIKGKFRLNHIKYTKMSKNSTTKCSICKNIIKYKKDLKQSYIINRKVFTHK